MKPPATPAASGTTSPNGVSPDLAVVILTMGDRPAELARAVDSVRRFRDVTAEIVVVGNGAPVPPMHGVRAIDLETNLGIPGGRNVGWAATAAPVVVFLDDDAEFAAEDAGRVIVTSFANRPGLGILSFLLADPGSGAVQRRHVPRVLVGDPRRGSDVTTFLGGACAVRRTVLESVGGLPDEFGYAHEETDLAWRALDAGWAIAYEPLVVVEHPATTPGRHAAYLRLNARNRVWLARRRLPWPMAVAYLAVWTALMTVRLRPSRDLAVWLRGFAEGWRTDAGPRQPMRWTTAWRMTLLGRPPVI